MTNIQARRVREIKALSGVVAALSLPVYGSAAFFDAWDGRFVSLYVGSVILTIAIGLQIYVRRPAAFGVAEIGDSLRTSYAVPSHTDAHLPSREAVAPLVRTSAPAGVDKVTPDKVTPRELLLQTVLTVGFVTLYAVAVVTVSGILTIAPGWAFFVAAAVILAVAFWIGQAFVVGASAPSPAATIAPEPVTVPTAPSATTPHAA